MGNLQLNKRLKARLSDLRQPDAGSISSLSGEGSPGRSSSGKPRRTHERRTQSSPAPLNSRPKAAAAKQSRLAPSTVQGTGTGASCQAVAGSSSFDKQPSADSSSFQSKIPDSTAVAAPATAFQPGKTCASGQESKTAAGTSGAVPVSTLQQLLAALAKIPAPWAASAQQQSSTWSLMAMLNGVKTAAAPQAGLLPQNAAPPQESCLQSRSAPCQAMPALVAGLHQPGAGTNHESILRGGAKAAAPTVAGDAQRHLLEGGRPFRQLTPPVASYVSALPVRQSADMKPPNAGRTNPALPGPAERIEVIDLSTELDEDSRSPRMSSAKCIETIDLT